MEDKLVPMSLIAKYLLPPWLGFYMKKGRFDPKVDSISKKALSTLRGIQWSKEKIMTFTQYQIDFGIYMINLKICGELSIL